MMYKGHISYRALVPGDNTQDMAPIDGTKSYKAFLSKTQKAADALDADARAAKAAGMSYGEWRIKHDSH